MEDKKGTAATRAKNKYNAQNYDRLYPYAPKGKKAAYLKAAEAAGMSLNEFMIAAMDEKAERVLGGITE
ncbi:MAG: DUF1778 domain-containing protein [Firmicutes bacterium]|nr:DUF1778 domain-containing protein [Bacillota bacterium]